MTARRSLVVLIATFALLLVGQPAQAGDWVVRSQKRLNSLGCSAGPADGVIGEWTRSAVVRFQAANRLKQTGRFNTTTRRTMRSEKAKRCDVRRVPARSGTGRRIVLSQRQNYVWLVRRNGTVRAQGGMVDNPASLSQGTHFTGPKCGRPGRVARNSDYGGSLWLYNFVRFAPCGVGFHRIPVYKSNGRQIHANYLVGTNLRESSGCIRLTRRMSNQLWDFTSRRTKVVVVWG